MTDTRDPVPIVTTTTTPPRKAMAGLGLGNTLEWYDWQIFGLLAAYIGPSFFAAKDPVSAALDALAVFAVGFVARPLGGVLLGTVADRLGRRRVMLWSVGTMAVTIAVIGLLPTHEYLGAWAGVALLICRILQGLSTGVEAPLSTAYAVELMPSGQEGRAAGYISFFVNFGILMASLVSFLTSYTIGGHAMSTWGWRIPVLFGAVMGFVVLYLRRSLPESLGPQEAEDSTGAVWGGVRKHWIGVLAIIVVVGAVQAYSYAWNVGLPTLARGAYGANPTEIFAVTTVLGLILLLGSILTGWWADRIRLSRAYLITRIIAIPTVFLSLLYVGHGLGMFTFVVLAGGVVLATNMTLYNVISSSLMPKYCRATGTGIGYGLGVAGFGGTASYLVVWLNQHHAGWLFPPYIAALSVISVVAYLIARKRSGIFLGE
ncbi:MHS family alpha-ketoglutarate permease-like MFS transporter [Nocardia sp. GAS34]|uniref:MFS transporter n=1 Tax=unclassified Nocardia TaxID=2637762 RepID=UPI003D25B8AB